MEWQGDVCVVGGGVAGAAAALHIARRGMGVALAGMASDTPSCDATEVLPPSAVFMLDALAGTEPALPGHACRGVLSRWQSAGVTFTDYELFGCVPGRALSRGAVTRWLSSRAERAGALLVQTGRLQATPSDSGWQIASSASPHRCRIVCRHLVDATGRSGKLIGSSTSHAYDDRAVCLFTRHGRPLRDPSLLLVDRSTNGWWYAVGAGAGLTDVSFITDADQLPARRARAAWMAHEYHDAALIGSALDEAPDFTHRLSRNARSGPAVEVSGPHWLAVGDAALACDPLSGHGMQFALESAAQAAEWIAGESAEDGYPGYSRWCSAAVQQYAAGRRATYRSAETGSRDGAFWQRRRAAWPASR